MKTKRNTKTIMKRVLRGGSPVVPNRVFMQTPIGETMYPNYDNNSYSIVLPVNYATDAFSTLKQNLIDRLVDLIDYVVENPPLETPVRISVSGGGLNSQVLYEGPISGVAGLGADFFEAFKQNTRMVVELLPTQLT